jgi:transcription elongation factor GreA
MAQNFYLTKEGLTDLKKQYEVLKRIRSAKTKGGVPEIWESEDLSSEYLSFQEDMTLLEKRIVEIEDILKNVALIKPPLKKNRNVVGLGATVSLEIDGDKDEFTIFGTLEANPSLGRISNESPVGISLLGHKIGDEIPVSSSVKTVYKIKKIKYN